MAFLTTDRIIAIGLVVALLASIFMGANQELQTNVAVGLIGYLGRVVTEGRSTGDIVKETAMNELHKLAVKGVSDAIAKHK